MTCIICRKALPEGRTICDNCINAEKRISKDSQHHNQTQQVSNGKALGFGIASLACGIYSLCTFYFPFVSLPCSIIALVFSKTPKGTQWEKFGTVGRITGIVALSLSSIMTVFLFALLFIPLLVPFAFILFYVICYLFIYLMMIFSLGLY